MNTHRLELISGNLSLNAELLLDGDAASKWTSDQVDMTIEQTEMINAILKYVNKINRRCGGLIKLEVTPL